MSQLCCSLSILWHCLSLGLKWKLTFPVLWPLLSFPNLQAYWVQHFHSIIIQDLRYINWNSITSTSLFIVMLPKAHLTSHSRISGSRWEITASWLSGSWRSFLYIYSVYSCHLFLISPVSVRSIPFLSFIEPIFALNFPLVSLIFLKRSLLSHSIVFLYFFALITEEGFLISPSYSLELCIQMSISFLFSFAFGFSIFTAICKTSSESHFPFLRFFFLGMVLLPVFCMMS